MAQLPSQPVGELQSMIAGATALAGDREILDSLPVAVSTVDHEGNLTCANRAMVALCGRAPQPGIDKWCLLDKLYDPDGRPLRPDECPMALAVKECRPIHGKQAIAQRPDGTRFRFESYATPLFDAQGNISGGIGVMLDISSRQAEGMKRVSDDESLRRNAETLRVLIEESPLGIYTVDSDFRIAHLSKGALPAFQNVQPVIGRDFAEVMRAIWPEPFAAEAIGIFRRVLETGEPYVSPGLTEKRRDIGAVESYEWQVNRVTLADGRFGVVCYYFDTTRLQQACQALDMARKQAEHASRAKDRFLAVLSHELRTPLSPVVMTVAAMEADPDLPLAMREDVAMIHRNIELEVRLIDDLLDLSRVTSGKMRLNMQPTNIHPVLKQAVQNCASDTLAMKLRVRLDFQATDDLVSGDSARLQQVFWNLIRNAAKFTPIGGEILIRTSSTAGAVRIEVRDTGMGIPAENLPKVFDAFEQGDLKTSRQFGGLGLGLAICKAVVDMHGGVIAAQSDGAGKGATFTVVFSTIAAGAESPRAARPPGHAGANGSLHVLLVEDHPDTAEVLSRLLRGSGFVVTAAANVASALNLAATQPFDIVVSDLGLPDGTGYELMQQIRDRHGIKGIALSGYGMEEDQRRSREAGFIDHVIKPVNFGQLTATIRRVAAGSAGP